MKARRISTGEEVEVTELTYTNMKTNVICRRDTKNGGFIAESDLELLPEESPESATIVEGWVVNERGDIGFYKEEPYEDDGWFGGFDGYLPPSFCLKLPLDSPRKVRITITPIEE